MATKEQKDELRRLRKLFRNDLDKLKATGYENWEIAEKARINSGNLSSYASGKGKQPGIEVLNRFYKAFEGELENPFKKITDMEDKKENNDQQKEPNGQKSSNGGANYGHDDVPPSDKTDEPESVPLYKDDAAGRTNELIATLKIENAHHRSVENNLLEKGDKLLQLPGRILDSVDKMVAIQDKTNQAVLNVTETQQKMFDTLLRKIGGEA